MRRHLNAIAATVVVGALAAGCGTDDEVPSDPPTSASPTSEEPAPEPTSAVPAGAGEGDVAIAVDGKNLPGDDWSPSCSESDGVLRFIANTPPLQTVQLELSTDVGGLESLVVSGEDFGPYSSDVNGAGGVAVEVTETGFELSGAFDDGASIEGTLTCPE